MCREAGTEARHCRSDSVERDRHHNATGLRPRHDARSEQHNVRRYSQSYPWQRRWHLELIVLRLNPEKERTDKKIKGEEEKELITYQFASCLHTAMPASLTFLLFH